MSVLRIAFAGTPQFSVPSLEALAGSTHELVGVLTQPDRPKGRGQSLSQSPVKLAALARGIPVAQPATLKTADGSAVLREWQPDLLVVVAYGLLLPKTVLELPRLGCVNVHASLLPRWRGAAPIQRAILAGDPVTGVTIMQMDVGLDTGPMLLRREIAIEARDTSATLHDRLASLGAVALMEAIGGLQSGSARPESQPADGVTYASRIDKSEAIIDWQRDAVSIARQVRAFQPWPVAETRLEGEQLRVHEALAIEETPDDRASSRQDADAGMVRMVADAGLIVQCGRGLLALSRVQRAGRRVMSAREFANAAPIVGRRLG